MKVVVGFLAFSVASACHASLISGNTFDAGDEGWTVVAADEFTNGVPVLGTAAAIFHSTGGNPGGFVETVDLDFNTTFFRASANYQGNLSSALNGTLTWDAQTDQSADYDGADVVIKGGGLTLVYNAPPAVTTTWSTQTVNLSANSNWHLDNTVGAVATAADFQLALSNVTDLFINAEYHNGVSETTGIDNVALNAVPEPATFAALGLGSLALLKRRRNVR